MHIVLAKARRPATIWVESLQHLTELSQEYGLTSRAVTTITRLLDAGSVILQTDRYSKYRPEARLDEAMDANGVGSHNMVYAPDLQRCRAIESASKIINTLEARFAARKTSGLYVMRPTAPEKFKAKMLNEDRILDHIKAHPNCTWFLDSPNSVCSLFPFVPPKVVLAKLRALSKRGLIEGCTCGCRGSFTIR